MEGFKPRGNSLEVKQLTKAEKIESINNQLKSLEMYVNDPEAVKTINSLNKRLSEVVLEDDEIVEPVSEVSFVNTQPINSEELL